MIASNNALYIIRQFEGLRLTAYQDVGGVWTIGYGDTVDVKPYMQITEDVAESRLLQRVSSVAEQVSKAVTVPLNQNQFDALVSFVYNVGIRRFKDSTMFALLQNNLYASAAAQFRFWRMAAGKVMPGLVNRRYFERQLFEKPVA